MADPIFSTPLSNPFGLTDTGDFAAPAFADIDGDGDLDAFVGNSAGDSLFFRNTGNAASPIFSIETANFGLTNVGFSARPSFADIDGDGDLDAFIGESFGDTLFFRNTGTTTAPVFTRESSNFGLANAGFLANPSFADIDGDGDLDAFVGNNNGAIQFFRNTGTSATPKFVAPAGNFGLTNEGFNASPSFVDIDGDSDLDAFVGTIDGVTVFFRNTGSASTPTFVKQVNNFAIADVGVSANPSFADIDGDGDLDAFIGDDAGNIRFFENTVLSRPVLTIPAAVTYTDTRFDDTFAPVNGFLSAIDANGDPLTYGITGGIDNGDGTVSLANALGTLTVNKTTGGYAFSAKDGVIEALTTAFSAEFKVTASDGLLNSSAALTIKIVQNGVTESNGNDALQGTAANESFNALLGNDTVNGGAGADIMRGGAGNDTYVVDNVGDSVIESSILTTEIDKVMSSISYALKANVENLILIGSNNLTGLGNTLTNSIVGNIGNNILNGLDGNDFLTGGLGKDVFRLTTLSRDKIIDFSIVDDTIQLENGVFNQLTATGVLSANNFKIGAAADADDFILYNSTTGIVTYDNNGNGVGGQTQIAVLGLGLALTNADFIVI